MKPEDYVRFVPEETETLVVGDLLGAGSFSVVHKARVKETKEVIAVKCYKSRRNSTADIYRAACEIAVVKSSNHPHIIKYILSDITYSYTLLGIEYSSHGTLLHVLPRSQNISEERTQIIMKQLFSALDYLHHRYIIHGDVKPENIIVTEVKPSITIKLSDFGLAEVYHPEERQLKVSSFVYMAPELHLGFPHDLSVDLYSAGVVMYELLYARWPCAPSLTRDIFIQTMRKRKPIYYPPEITKSLSESCTSLMKSLLQYDSGRRPTSKEILKHPFINLGEQDYPALDHYRIACNYLIDSAELAAREKYSQAYIDAATGLLHIQIYARSIASSDQGLCDYLIQRTKNYLPYLNQLETKILTPDTPCSVEFLFSAERLRLMLSSTPAVRDAYDICLVGEMYIRQNKVELGCDKLKDGLEALFLLLRNEPNGVRRTLLAKKMEDWVLLLEQVEDLSAMVDRPFYWHKTL